MKLSIFGSYDTAVASTCMIAEKDEGMRAVGNDRIHTAHEGHEFHRRIVAVGDDGFRLHAAGNVAAGFDVGRSIGVGMKMTWTSCVSYNSSA